MGIESCLVHSFGVNVENQRLAQRFVKMDADAAGFRTSRFQKKFQLFAKLLFSWQWLKTKKRV